MSRSVAAELLLLALDEKSGKGLVDGSTLNAALAGTAVAELAAAGALALQEVDGGEVKAGRLRRTGVARPSDPLLAEVVDTCHGKKPGDAVGALTTMTFTDRGAKLQEQLLAELVAEGVLTHERGKVLGLFPTQRWPEADPAVEREVRERVRAVLVLGAEPDPRTALLVSMLSVTKLAPKVFPGDDGKAVQARADAVRESGWAGGAVAKALEDLMAVVMVTTLVPVVVATSS
ncbi:Golgi phosphoprotein 3 (GPP34) [Klenkia marina]|uniref:Golgi phosphoprotein 3 (GPP34) n=1 Tax=Klenkia marina TaxID=1960309 RepID=A0A1G4XBI8_9ACTN|nr:GPP34 family phosphoprotein [Klenkia marina]SCX38535.1 Golgi phosphoprotein 3 (GPP34) [Klenkia marina]